MEKTEFVASRVKTALYLLAVLGGAALLLLLPGQAGHGVRWVSEPFFCGCALVFALLLARPQRLALDGQGFTLSGGLLRTPETVAWHTVGGFRVVHVAGIAMIGFDDAAAPTSREATLFRRLVGADGALTGLWPGPSAAIVDTLNAYRGRAVG